MSMFFGSTHNMKSVTAAEAAAIAAFRVRDKGDRVGGIIFDDTDLHEIRPHSSVKTLNRFLDVLAQANCKLDANAPTVVPIPLSQPIRAAARIVKSGALVMVFSDFDGWDDETERNLRNISQRNELILFSVTDPTSKQLPPDLDIVVSDGELQAQVNAKDETVRRRLADFSTGRLASLFAFSAKYSVPIVPFTAAEDTLPQLLRLLGGGLALR
jgi:uncharacterized protein (DUF58 family)